MKGARCLSIVLSSCLVALLSTGNATANDAGPEVRRDAAQEVDCRGGSEATLAVTSLGANQYLFYQEVLLNQPIDRVWPEIRDAQSLVAITLPAATSTFEWLDGGGPEIVPSRFEFSLGDATLVEEVVYRLDPAHQVLYRLVTPGFGLEQYYAAADLTRACGQKTRLKYLRYIEVDPGVSVDGLEQLAAQEISSLQAFFDGST